MNNKIFLKKLINEIGFQILALVNDREVTSIKLLACHLSNMVDLQRKVS